jgi:predicted transcriptional regulator of viral defense system
MKTHDHFEKIQPLLAQPLFRSAEARERGVSAALLSYYARKGLIEKLQRGVYRGKTTALDVDFKYEDLVLAAQSIPDGIVCLVSALDLYGLTDEIPREHHIALDHDRKPPRRDGVRIVRMRNTSIGRTMIPIGNTTISIFDRERTIVDAFRFLGKETALKALKRALSAKTRPSIDTVKIMDYARKLRVNIEPYLLAVTV